MNRPTLYPTHSHFVYYHRVKNSCESRHLLLEGYEYSVNIEIREFDREEAWLKEVVEYKIPR